MNDDLEIVPLISTDQFISWIEENRKSAELSFRDMARAARLSHGTVSNMRRDSVRDVKLSTVARVADVFGYRLALVRNADK